MKLKYSAICFLIFVLSVVDTRAQTIVPDNKIFYKEINSDSLYLHVFEPNISEKPTAAVVFFFGGGWVSGHPKQFYQQAEYLASRGILAISAEYRVNKKHNTTPFDAVEDGKSVIRWLRQHAKELHINPDKIAAAGASAGGHIALCTALINTIDNANEDKTISAFPNAVIAYNAVFDTTENGYGSEKVKGRETEISPCHNIKKNKPPMLLFHGKDDKTVPFENAVRFNTLMKKANNECELVAFDGVGYGFFNGSFFRKKIMILILMPQCMKQISFWKS